MLQTKLDIHYMLKFVLDRREKNVGMGNNVGLYQHFPLYPKGIH